MTVLIFVKWDKFNYNTYFITTEGKSPCQMPHVILSEKYEFTRIYIQFKKKINKIENNTIIKYDDSFINSEIDFNIIT